MKIYCGGKSHTDKLSHTSIHDKQPATKWQNSHPHTHVFTYIIFTHMFKQTFSCSISIFTDFMSLLANGENCSAVVSRSFSH